MGVPSVRCRVGVHHRRAELLHLTSIMRSTPIYMHYACVDMHTHGHVHVRVHVHVHVHVHCRRAEVGLAADEEARAVLWVPRSVKPPLPVAMGVIRVLRAISVIASHPYGETGANSPSTCGNPAATLGNP